MLKVALLVFLLVMAADGAQAYTITATPTEFNYPPSSYLSGSTGFLRVTFGLDQPVYINEFLVRCELSGDRWESTRIDERGAKIEHTIPFSIPAGTRTGDYRCQVGFTSDNFSGGGPRVGEEFSVRIKNSEEAANERMQWLTLWVVIGGTIATIATTIVLSRERGRRKHRRKRG